MGAYSTNLSQPFVQALLILLAASDVQLLTQAFASSRSHLDFDGLTAGNFW
jgi:hypothetical protein